MSKKSVLDKINPIHTLQKRKKEIEDLKNESKNAIERIQNLNIDPSYYNLRENQEISTLGLGEKKKLEPLLQLLIEWINSELADCRVIVKDLQEDLYDGHIMRLLLEKLTGSVLANSKLNLGESTQKNSLKQVLVLVNTALNVDLATCKWTVENIYDKEIIPILHLLVAIVKYFKVPISLPNNVAVNVIVVKKGKHLEKKTIVEQITENDQYGAKRERDAFDALFDHAPEKLTLVKNSFLTFVNKHLKKIRMEIADIDKELNDGVKLILLMGLLEDYFVPDYCYHPQPTTSQQKVDNIKLLFDLMDDAGVTEPTCKAEDIANGDLKSTLRIVYNLFTKYKDRN